MDNGYSSSVKKPWGNYRILCKKDGFCVKLIEVDPGGRLSLQKHLRRIEKWIITKGAGLARAGDKERKVQAGDIVEIPLGEIHRIANIANDPLVFVEISFGDYIEEDDIVRIEDDYQRLS